MSGKSSKTQVVGIRLDNEVVEKIRSRVAKNRFDSISAYLRERITYDIMRKHTKHASP